MRVARHRAFAGLVAGNLTGKWFSAKVIRGTFNNTGGRQSMGYRNLQSCLRDLERQGHLVRLETPVSAGLEAAEIQRRCYARGGPAVLFTNVQQCRFPMVSNLFGTIERARFIFRDTLEPVKRAIELKVAPERLMQNLPRYWRAPLTALHMRPRRLSGGAVLKNSCRISDLPQLVSWPRDGGPFITLPQVYSEDARAPGLARSNLGMYRVQLGGNDYVPDREIGLHYQIHRGIGVHHRAALDAGQPFRVSIFVGGPPAMTLAAVMPLPEGMSELGFAGALAGHRIRMLRIADGSHISADADFVITGTVLPHQEKPEGPFGDHLGYYSLAHDFPVLQVEQVWHRDAAVWPFTVVGRPPQEDTAFGELIHEITGPVLPSVLPGVREVNAVDAAGVHPLLLAIGSERYVPYRPTDRPAELLTQAHAILGQGQLSLAKYLWIIDGACDPELRASQIADFFVRVLQRVDWTRDLHFQTQTTIDTLDYSGDGLNQGSKVIIAAAGPARRALPTRIPDDLQLPAGFDSPRQVLPGILAIRGPDCTVQRQLDPEITRFCESFQAGDSLNQFPLVVIVDDSPFTADTLNNFLWVAFTRSSPATDIHGIEAFVERKHWGCRGSLVLDARIKPHHAPPLESDPKVAVRIDALAAAGGPLARWL